MRFTTFSVAGCFMIGLAFCAWWFADGPVETLHQAAAQDAVQDAHPQVAADRTDPFENQQAVHDQHEADLAVTASEEQNTKETEAKLAEFIDVDFFDEPIRGVAEFLKDNADLQIHFKQACLEKIEQPITMAFRSIRISMLLDIALHEHNLDYVVQDGIVFISTAEEIAATPEIRIYDCSDLVRIDENRIDNRSARPKSKRGNEDSGMQKMEEMMKRGKAGSGVSEMEDMMRMMAGGGSGGVPAVSKQEMQYNDLVKLVKTTIEPDSWSDVGGTGSVSLFQGMMVINNSAKVHRHTAALLEKIRRAKNLTR